MFGPPRPKIPKEIKHLKNIDIQDVYMQWPVYMTWAGGAMVFFGVIWLVWFSRKDIGVRLIVTGVSLAMVAKVMIWLGNWMWPLIGVCAVVYAACNPRRVEKTLSKIGIFVDIDGDGMIGTGRTSKKAGKKWLWFFRRKYVEPETSPDIENDHSLSHDDIDTDVIPKQD